MARDVLREMGYPEEGIVSVDTGGGDGYDVPQEALSPHTCISCRKCDGAVCMKEWNNGDPAYYVPERDDRDVDNDTCEDIEYEEEWLDSEGGYRSPVRCEYSSDENYKKACEVIKAINREIREEWEKRMARWEGI